MGWFWWGRRKGADDSTAAQLDIIQEVQQELRQLIDAITQNLNETRTDLNRLHYQVDQLKKANEPPHPKAQSEGDEELERLLDAAAGIAYAEVFCHRDTYDFIVTAASSMEHFRLPAIVAEKEDLIEARLSGRSLVAIIEVLNGKLADRTGGTKSMSKRPYRAIEQALAAIEPGTAPTSDRSAPRPVVQIVIDDRPVAAA